MSETGAAVAEVEAIWVNTTEGAEFTGYNHEHVRLLARTNWQLPENERIIKVRRRSNRYDIWLPDLVKYIELYGQGPRKRDNK